MSMKSSNRSMGTFSCSIRYKKKLPAVSVPARAVSVPATPVSESC